VDRLSDVDQSSHDTERALQEGDGDRGSRHQKEAQRLLEMARDQQSEEGESEGQRDGQSKQAAKRTEIPDKNKHKSPEDFRRRVIEGLGGSADPLLREAVKRY